MGPDPQPTQPTTLPTAQLDTTQSFLTPFRASILENNFILGCDLSCTRGAVVAQAQDRLSEARDVITNNRDH